MAARRFNVAQELTRHSDPKLTLNVYTASGIHDLSGALDALPDFGPRPRQAEPLRAVGADDRRADKVSPAYTPAS
jgi:hypothetical protein